MEVWLTVGPDVPDYSRPSVDVERRAGADWQWGFTHTVRPEKLAPLLPDVEYSVTVKVQRTVSGIWRTTWSRWSSGSNPDRALMSIPGHPDCRHRLSTPQSQHEP